jgi:hypothetical protein
VPGTGAIQHYDDFTIEDDPQKNTGVLASPWDAG